jgi:phosphatidylserine/phosphatidylglycerophosphate/cardiolipin synthase-like enzyme
MTTRQVLQRSADARNTARELLQTIFAAELLSPSRTLWIVSPWLRDIPVLDNRNGGFVALDPEFPRGLIRLSRVLRSLLNRGSKIVVATRLDLQSREVVEAVRYAAAGSNVIHREADQLHAKGIVSDTIALVGSMNFTHNGIERLTEMLVFHTDPKRVAEIRLDFDREYGGLS